MGEKISRSLREQLIESARWLRNNPTRAEVLLWNKLRKKQLGGLRFRRQHIIHTFIVDFYCPEARLVIEVDGSAHKNQEEYDSERSAILEISGYSVMRFRNVEIEREMDKVLAIIYDTCLRRINEE